MLPALIVAAALSDTPVAMSPTWCSVPVEAAAAEAGRWKVRIPLGEPPHPLAHVHTEHTLAGDPGREASLKAERDLPLMRDAALAWRAGAGSEYGAFAARYLNAWVSIYQPDLNPIDETGFDAFVETWAMLRPDVRPESRAAVDHYFQGWAKGYVEAIDKATEAGRRNGTWTNNWNSHRVKLVAMTAAATDDPRLFEDARRLYWSQMDANVAPSGEVLDFSQRDALHYVVYDLEPLLRAALAARSRGEDWWRARKPGSPSLEAAVRWLRPYAAGETPHEEFVHSSVAFDAERARNGEKGYSGPWDRTTAARVYWMAAEFDPSYRALAEKLGPAPTFVTLCGQ
jgi:hypothetical protein